MIGAGSCGAPTLANQRAGSCGAPTLANQRARRAAELSRALAAKPLDDEDCLVWFGVCRTTIERVVEGEIEPGDELGETIDRYLAAIGGAGVSVPAPSTPTEAGL